MKKFSIYYMYFLIFAIVFFLYANKNWLGPLTPEHFFCVRMLIIAVEFVCCAYASLTIIWNSHLHSLLSQIKGIRKSSAQLAVFIVLYFIFSVVVAGVFFKINLFQYIHPTHTTESMANTVKVLNQYSSENLLRLSIEELDELNKNPNRINEKKLAEKEMQSYLAPIMNEYRNPFSVIPPISKGLKPFVPISTIDMISRVFVITWGILLIGLLLFIFLSMLVMILYSKCKNFAFAHTPTEKLEERLTAKIKRKPYNKSMYLLDLHSLYLRETRLCEAHSLLDAIDDHSEKTNFQLEYQYILNDLLLNSMEEAENRLENLKKEDRDKKRFKSSGQYLEARISLAKGNFDDCLQQIKKMKSKRLQEDLLMEYYFAMRDYKKAQPMIEKFFKRDPYNKKLETMLSESRMV